MKVTTITLLFFTVSCVAITRIVLDIKREAIGFRSSLVWIALWVGIGIFSLFPSALNYAMRLAQMQNRMFFILVVAVFILFALVFNLTSRLDKMERNIAELVQQLAMVNYKLENIGNDKQKD